MAVNGKLVASADPDGTVKIVEGYENGDETNSNGHKPTCDDRRKMHTSRVLAEVIEVNGRRNAKVIRLISSAPDGVSTSPEAGDVMNILPSALYPLDNDRNTWGVGSIVPVDCQMNSAEDWEQRGYSAYVVTSIHIWCCVLKSMAKRVAPLTPEAKAAVAAAARITALRDRFKAIMADAAEHSVDAGMVAADNAASSAYSDFRASLKVGNERESEVALECFQIAVTKLIPSGISVAKMAELAAELPDDLAAF